MCACGVNEKKSFFFNRVRLVAGTTFFLGTEKKNNSFILLIKPAQYPFFLFVFQLPSKYIKKEIAVENLTNSEHFVLNIGCLFRDLIALCVPFIHSTTQIQKKNPC